MIDRRSFEEVMELAIKKMNGAGPLVRVTMKDAIILGDLHGDLHTLESILEKYGDGHPRYVALGDYVDRGEYQVETLYKVLELFVDGSLIPLRGNHESRLTSFDYGFAEEAMHYLGGDLFNRVLSDLFPRLPYAAVLNDCLFLVHGGVPNPIPSLADIEKLRMGDADPADPVAFQLLWNDPAEIKGYAPNPRGPGIYLFGSDVTESFLKINHLSAIVRGHEFFAEGYELYHDSKVISIFTSKGGVYRQTKPKVLRVVDGEAEIIDVETSQVIKKMALAQREEESSQA
ncbi:serine/threonine protein phosphatase [Thermocladium modestius]|uniref:Serine/threonine protein phosphatase n=1 Tax=Thermocladium modestius TaxID=62609 RepID=A0A830GXW2_9CREN|nr:metallophosphoesterase family protein [Thermocladium modestius]GGP20499.1 serine/threonine protein phosphatase [Thermocladium modestius]